MDTLTAKPFVRDRFTWLAYFMMAFYTYLQALVGLSMPFVRTRLNLSYSMGAMHISAFALGVILSGSRGERRCQRWGRYRIFWIGGAGMGLGALGLAQGTHVILTLASTFTMGLFGALLLLMVQAALSDQYGEQRTIALTEANVGASLGASLAPLIIGSCHSSGLGWPSAMWVAAAVFVGLATRFYAQPLPVTQARPARSDREPQRLPLPYWAYWILGVLDHPVYWHCC